MELALEEAGARLTGWVNSCLSCLVPCADDESHYHAESLKSRGSERDTQVCHSPPHLILPMESSFGNDPQRESRSYQPPWPSLPVEGKDWIPRTAIRPTLSLKKSASKRISGPSDFRRVEAYWLPDPGSFSPLELSIHSPGNRLSSLPNFESFQFDGARVQPIAPPPRVLSGPQRSCSRSYRPGVSYQFLRKPVRSGTRQPSLYSVGSIDQPVERQIPNTNPLIPHFSNRIPTSAAASETAPLPVSRLSSFSRPIPNENRPTTSRGTQTPPTPKPPTSPTEQVEDVEEARPLPPLPAASPSTSFRRRPPQTPESTFPPAPSSRSMRPSRITTNCYSTAPTPKPTSWLHSTSSRSTTSATDRGTVATRTRRLSGSTIASSPSMSSWTTTTTTTTTTGASGFRKTPSLSSTVTPSVASSVTARPSLQESRIEKDYERPHMGKCHALSWPVENSTIYEGQPPLQPQQLQQQDCERRYGYNNNRFYSRYRESGIGLAF